MFVSRYYHFDSIKDISMKSGKSENAVKTILFRLRQKLKVFLTKKGYVV